MFFSKKSNTTSTRRRMSGRKVTIVNGEICYVDPSSPSPSPSPPMSSPPPSRSSSQGSFVSVPMPPASDNAPPGPPALPFPPTMKLFGAPFSFLFNVVLIFSYSIRARSSDRGGGRSSDSDNCHAFWHQNVAFHGPNSRNSVLLPELAARIFWNAVLDGEYFSLRHCFFQLMRIL